FFFFFFFGGASLTGATYRRADKHSAIRQNNWEFIQNYW
ncbi:hypothetical protein K802_19945, partial [Salmonella enterica subsp. enterica serovar Newport str. SHSN012]